MSINLKNKKALIAGGCGLIGRAIVKYFKKCGADTVNMDIAPLADVEFKLSLENTAEFRTYLEDNGPFDIFVNTTYPKSPYTHMEVYLMSAKAAAWHMRKHGGAIVLISSIYGIVGCDPRLYQGTDVQEPLIEYHFVKAGINGEMRALATLYGPQGVRCNCVSPGGIYDGQDDKFVKRYIQHVPLRRMGTPEDVAHAVAFLASDLSSYITGQNLMVAGGLTTYAWL